MKDKLPVIKAFGQHFLRHPRTQKRIVDTCGITAQDHVLEIGPGKGAITSLLAEQAKHLWAIEKDRRLYAYLKNYLTYTNITFLNENILVFDPVIIPLPFIVVGNIPYNISTPILEWLIDHKNMISKAFLTVQWEFGLRLIAKPGTKDYGALSCFIQYHGCLKKHFKMSKNEFNPPPKIDSCFIEIDFSQHPSQRARDEVRLFQIIRFAFHQRRKQLLKVLKRFDAKVRWKEIFERLSFKPTVRAEELTLSNFIKLADISQTYFATSP